jgi:hypothetical protein
VLRQLEVLFLSALRLPEVRWRAGAAALSVPIPPPRLVVPMISSQDEEFSADPCHGVRIRNRPPDAHRQGGRTNVAKAEELLTDGTPHHFR